MGAYPTGIKEYSEFIEWTKLSEDRMIEQGPDFNADDYDTDFWIYSDTETDNDTDTGNTYDRISFDGLSRCRVEIPQEAVNEEVTEFRRRHVQLDSAWLPLVLLHWLRPLELNLMDDVI